MEIRTCAICGEEFETSNSEQEFCDDCIAIEEVYAMDYVD